MRRMAETSDNSRKVGPRWPWSPRAETNDIAAVACFESGLLLLQLGFERRPILWLKLGGRMHPLTTCHQKALYRPEPSAGRHTVLL